MTKEDKAVNFKTFKQYRVFYALDAEQKQVQGSKYYQIGASIAKMACQKAVDMSLNEQGQQVS